MQDINLFDPTVEKLQALVLETAGIVEVNIDDPKQIETVKKARINLRNARTSIEKTGKAYREDALKYQKAVIEKERSLIAIIEPEETRLKMFEKSAELAKERRLRIAQLPERKKRLINLGVNIEEKYILEMDSVTFEERVTALVAEKNEKEREEQDRINREKEADLKRREDELHAREREEKARADERERIAREAQEKADREKREADFKAKMAEEEKARLQVREAYQAFLSSNGWSKETAHDFKEEQTPEGIVLWKKVATFKIV
jgi:nicotinamide mononucleotide adenylyltransferase